MKLVKYFICNITSDGMGFLAVVYYKHSF